VVGEEAADLGGEIGDVLEQEAVARIRVEDELRGYPGRDCSGGVASRFEVAMFVGC
jgi:acyl-coenzyme A thioesterase PaaI-like protein